MPRQDLIELREGTAAQWAGADPVLSAGEPGWDSTNGILKIGDGATAWSALPGYGAGTFVPQAEPIWVGPEKFILRNGAATLGVLNTLYLCWLMPDSADSSMRTTMRAPSYWDTWKIVYFFAPALGGGGAARVAAATGASPVVAGGIMGLDTGQFLNGTDFVVGAQFEVFAAETSSEVNVGGAVSPYVLRDADNAGDTLVGNLAFLGALMVPT
jgi:hypothetical protein